MQTKACLLGQSADNIYIHNMPVSMVHTLHSLLLILTLQRKESIQNECAHCSLEDLLSNGARVGGRSLKSVTVQIARSWNPTSVSTPYMILQKLINLCNPQFTLMWMVIIRIPTPGIRQRKDHEYKVQHDVLSTEMV